VKRTLLVLLTILAGSLDADAQTTPRLVRVAFLSASAAANDQMRPAFIEGLREHGYTEGQNLVLESRYVEGRFERLPALATELVRLKCDVIVAAVTQASLAARDATATIPIVMIGVADPVGAGLVASLARPGATSREPRARSPRSLASR
jgi:putative ABC transport system substrate-binding protein